MMLSDFNKQFDTVFGVVGDGKMAQRLADGRCPECGSFLPKPVDGVRHCGVCALVVSDE